MAIDGFIPLLSSPFVVWLVLSPKAWPRFSAGLFFDLVRPNREQTGMTDDATRTEIEAAAFRRLLAHLDARKDVQNIELMNLAGFCRNCLAKWYAAAAAEQGVAIDYDQARERVYGMPYAEWKALYQTEAT